MRKLDGITIETQGSGFINTNTNIVTNNHIIL